MNKVRLFEIKKRLFPALINSKQMNNYLVSKGVKVGKGCIFYDAGSQTLDVTRPCLLEIGDYVKITAGVTVLTHDYSRSVLRRAYGPVIGEGRKTVIGNNVFIGINSIILMGTTIGDNVIVGAGSVVSGKVPSNCVVAGNPAVVIRTLEEHYEKRKEQSIKEAFEYVSIFEEKYNRLPTVKEMDPFYWLFMKRDLSLVSENRISMKLGGDEQKETEEAFLASSPVFDGYDKFIEEWKKRR